MTVANNFMLSREGHDNRCHCIQPAAVSMPARPVHELELSSRFGQLLQLAAFYTLCIIAHLKEQDCACRSGSRVKGNPKLHYKEFRLGRVSPRLHGGRVWLYTAVEAHSIFSGVHDDQLA